MFLLLKDIKLDTPVLINMDRVDTVRPANVNNQDNGGSLIYVSGESQPYLVKESIWKIRERLNAIR